MAERAIPMLCAVSEPSGAAGPGAGKGRPRPKRRDAQKRRRQAIPGNPKEAAKVRREQAREIRAQQRKALQTGDEKHLPARDAGPAKRLARDLVDSRFTVGQVFFGLILVVLVSSFVVNPHNYPTVAAAINVLALLAVFAVFTDSVLIGRKAKRM